MKKLNIFTIILGIVGLFYFAIPHSLHISSGFSFGLPHVNHIAYGAILLLLAFLFSRKDIDYSIFSDGQFVKLLTVMVIGVIGLDFIWHRFFTSDVLLGATNILYYLAKFWITLYLVVLIYEKGTLDLKDIVIKGLIFTGILSIYYRFYELIGSIEFGTLAPNVILGSTTYTLSNGLTFALIWLGAHSLVFIIPLLIWRKFFDR